MHQSRPATHHLPLAIGSRAAPRARGSGTLLLLLGLLGDPCSAVDLLRLRLIEVREVAAVTLGAIPADVRCAVPRSGLEALKFFHGSSIGPPVPTRFLRLRGVGLAFTALAATTALALRTTTSFATFAPSTTAAAATTTTSATTGEEVRPEGPGELRAADVGEVASVTLVTLAHDEVPADLVTRLDRNVVVTTTGVVAVTSTFGSARATTLTFAPFTFSFPFAFALDSEQKFFKH